MRARAPARDDAGPSASEAGHGLAPHLSMSSTTNPLLDASGLPRFDEIRVEHVEPGIQTLLDELDLLRKVSVMSQYSSTR